MSRWSIKSTFSQFRKWWIPSEESTLIHQQENQYRNLQETSLENRILLSANPLIAIDDGGDATISAGEAASDGQDDTFHIQKSESMNGDQFQVVINGQAFVLGDANSVRSIRVLGSQDNDILTIDRNAIPNSGISFDGGFAVGDSDRVVIQDPTAMAATDSLIQVADVSYRIHGDDVSINVSDSSANHENGGTIGLRNVESVVDLIDSVNRSFTFEGESTRVTVEQTDDFVDPALTIKADQAFEVNFFSPQDRVLLDTNDSFQQTIEVTDIGTGFFDIQVSAGSEDHLTFVSAGEPVMEGLIDTAPDGQDQSNSRLDSNEIVFVDSRVQDYQSLIAGIRADIDVVLLDATRSGLLQITTALEGKTGLNSIHVISHGSPGSLFLGSLELSSDNIDQYSEQLSTIGTALTDSGDILLYGCNVAEGARGAEFVAGLAQATKADVAASVDATGAASRGGDWHFESVHGFVDTNVVISSLAQASYAFLLAPPKVSTVETSDALITDSDAGDTFTVTVTFDQAMDSSGGFNPTLTFDPDVFAAGTLTSPSAGSWSLGDTVFTQTFAMDDVNVDVADVEIDVTGAQNTSGQGLNPYSPEAEFSIDTVNPSVVVDIVDGSLNSGDPSSLVTFEFSEDVIGFDVTDLSSPAGTFSNFTVTDGDSYTATFTANDDLETTGSVTVAATYTDLAGNTGATGSDNVAIDTLNPTVVVNIVDSQLNDGDPSSSVTFEFSEDVIGFDATDLSSAEGTFSNFTVIDGDSYTATFTVADGLDTTGSVTVAATYTDLAGNIGATGSDNVAIDTLNPTVVVNIVDGLLNDGDLSSSVTFEFSVDVIGFDVTDLSSAEGTFSNFTVIDGNSYTATFTTTDDLETTGTVTVTSTYTDQVGNTGTTGSDNVTIDTRNPTVVVDIVDGSLNSGDPSSLVTFEFSEDVIGFDVTDLSSPAGTFSNFTVTDGDSYTATFTANDDLETTGSVTVAATYTDLAGNTGATGSDNVAIDTLNPTVVVNIVDSQLNDGDPSSSVTFEFSEDVIGFDATDLSSAEGTFSNFTVIDGDSYTATFTVADGLDTTGSVTVAATYTDLAGNIGATGSDNVAIDTLNPTVVVSFAETSLNDGNLSSLVTFEFSEDVIGFDDNDLSSTVGTLLSDFTVIDGDSYTAIFTAADGLDTTGTVTVTSTYTDQVGNTGTTGSENIPIDTVNPSVVVDFVDGSLNDGNPSSVVTFEFSEDVIGFDVTDLSSPAGTFSNFTVTDGDSYTATFTANDDLETTGSVTVAATYTDLAGNTGAIGVDNVVIDTLNPTVVVNIVDSQLNDGDPNSSVTFEFSENVIGFDATDLSSAEGTFSNFTVIDGNSYTATFTVVDGLDTTGSVTVAATYTDLAGNTGATGSDNVAIDTSNPMVMSIQRTDQDYTNQFLVGFTVEFSEDVSGVDLNGSDFTLSTSVVGASIINVSGSGSIYTVSVNTGSSDGTINLDLGAVPTVEDLQGNSLVNSAVGGADETYTIATTEVLVMGGNVMVNDIRDATVDNVSLSQNGGYLEISSPSSPIAIGPNVLRVGADVVRVLLSDITGTEGITVVTGDLDDMVTIVGISRGLSVNGGGGFDTVKFETEAVDAMGADIDIVAEEITQDTAASITANDLNLHSSNCGINFNADVTLTGNLTLIAGDSDPSNGVANVTQIVTGIDVAGRAVFTAEGDITLMSGENDFRGAIDAKGANLNFGDMNGIDLGTMVTAGNLSVTAGDIVTDSGAQMIAGSTSVSAGSDIALNDGGSDFVGMVTAQGANVTVFDTNVLNIGDVTAAGSINLRAGSDLVITSGATLRATAPGSRIDGVAGSTIDLQGGAQIVREIGEGDSVVLSTLNLFADVSSPLSSNGYSNIDEFGNVAVATTIGVLNADDQNYGFQIDWNDDRDSNPTTRLPAVTSPGESDIATHKYQFGTGRPFRNQTISVTVVADFENMISFVQAGKSLTTQVIPFELTAPVGEVPIQSDLSVPELRAIPSVVDSTIPSFAVNQTTIIAPADFDDFESSELDSGGEEDKRYYELRLVDQNNDDVGEPILLPEDILDENQLKKLFRNLPDDHYRIYLILEDGSEQLVFDINIRDQEAVDAAGNEGSEYELENRNEGAGEATLPEVPTEPPSNLPLDVSTNRLPVESPGPHLFVVGKLALKIDTGTLN